MWNDRVVTSRQTLFVLRNAAMIMMSLIFADEAPAAIDYVLDQTQSELALYPGPGYRSFVRDTDMVRSFEDLKRRVSRLPKGTSLHWKPYRREPSGTPILFGKGQFEEFERLCKKRGIQLVVAEGSSAK